MGQASGRFQGSEPFGGGLWAQGWFHTLCGEAVVFGSRRACCPSTGTPHLAALNGLLGAGAGSASVAAASALGGSYFWSGPGGRLGWLMLAESCCVAGAPPLSTLGSVWAGEAVAGPGRPTNSVLCGAGAGELGGNITSAEARGQVRVVSRPPDLQQEISVGRILKTDVTS